MFFFVIIELSVKKNSFVHSFAHFRVKNYDFEGPNPQANLLPSKYEISNVICFYYKFLSCSL